MKRRDFTAGVALSVLAPVIARAAPTVKMQETPSLAEQVKAGSLPTVDKRIPDAPSIVKHFSGADGAGRPGLGAMLYRALDERAGVVGVAKTSFAGATACVPVIRGSSQNPLYVSAAGIDAVEF